MPARKPAKAPKTGTKKTATRRRAIDWAARAAGLTNARRAKVTATAFVPQLAKLGRKPPEGDKWLHEIKWDGYRLVAKVVNGKAHIWSRNAIKWTHKVPGIAKCIEELGVGSVALDGELIAGLGTQADFNLLQAVLSGVSKSPLIFVLFDLLYLEGYDVNAAPLVERKALLCDLLKGSNKQLAFSTHIPGDGQAAFALASERKFEGIISKRVDAGYHAGRGDDWRKTKDLASDEFAVVGYTPSKGSRIGFGSLLLARPVKEHGWRYAGRVGSGFSDELIRDLVKRIGKRGDPSPTVEITATKAKELKGALWFPPLFVVEAYIRGIGTSGLLRQPSLKAIRLDKTVKDLGK